MEGGEPALVTLVIQRYRKLTRGPYGVDEALQRVSQADENSLQRIILGRSELAWRAYYAASKAAESDHGFSGKAELIRLLNDLRAQPVDHQRAFAEQLTCAMGSEEVDMSRQNAKRRRTTVENYVVTSAPSVITTINSTDTRNLDSESYVPGDVSNQLVSQRDVYFGAPLEPAERLFHRHFWDSIQRIPSGERPGIYLADISMLFQKGYIRDHFGCQMEIRIAEEKVPDLAFEYFGVKLESKDGVRSVRYPGGGKIEPDPSIKLRACRQDLSGIFQGDLYEAICTSPIYQREKSEMRTRTDGVSMTITNQAKEDGKLTVFLGEWRASTIKSKLYG
ncbi:hypothetical protein F5Y17DRAFT_242214 [Xylariaceae sp. FL0594]|nr:hypothetical protein F5Y17DRAFT_242214 [Xylariaceae sp. FL0594]